MDKNRQGAEIPGNSHYYSSRYAGRSELCAKPVLETVDQHFPKPNRLRDPNKPRLFTIIMKGRGIVYTKKRTGFTVTSVAEKTGTHTQVPVFSMTGDDP